MSGGPGVADSALADVLMDRMRKHSRDGFENSFVERLAPRVGNLVKMKRNHPPSENGKYFRSERKTTQKCVVLALSDCGLAAARNSSRTSYGEILFPEVTSAELTDERIIDMLSSAMRPIVAKTVGEAMS